MKNDEAPKPKKAMSMLITACERASHGGTANDATYKKSIKKALNIAKYFVKHNFYDEAYIVAKALHIDLHNNIKRTAAIHASRLFLYNNKHDYCLKLADLCLQTSGTMALRSCAMIAQDLYRRGFLNESEHIVKLIQQQRGESAKKIIAEIKEIIDVEKKGTSDIWVKKAIEHVKNEKESHDPDQIFAIASATKYCRLLLQGKHYDDIMTIYQYLCTDDLGLMKSDLVIEITKTLLENDQKDLVVEMSKSLMDIHCAFKMKTVKVVTQLLHEKGQVKEEKEVLTALNESGIQQYAPNKKRDKEIDQNQLMDMKRLQYNELLDNELAHSKHDLSDRDITFIDQKKVRSIQGLFEKILGRQHQEIQMKFRDPELKCNLEIYIRKGYWKCVQRKPNTSNIYTYNIDSRIFNKNDESGDEASFNEFVDYLSLPFNYSDEQFEKVNLTFK